VKPSAELSDRSRTDNCVPRQSLGTRGCAELSDGVALTIAFPDGVWERERRSALRFVCGGVLWPSDGEGEFAVGLVGVYAGGGPEDFVGAGGEFG
jgi:hypothetical protein